jgi:hypothetical protein
VFTEAEERRERVLRVASWISGGSGMITAVQLIEGDATSAAVHEQCREAEAKLTADVERHGLDAYALAIAAPDLRAASQTLLQGWGLGPIRANTVMLNWYETRDPESAAVTSLRYARLVRRAIRLDKSLVLVDAEEADWEALGGSDPEHRRIDVWWLDDDSSRLALLFAYLMTRTPEWDEAKIRLLVPTQAAHDGGEDVRAALAARLKEMRIRADVEPVEPDAASMCARSAESSIVLLPLRSAGVRVRGPFGGPLETLLERLPVALMVAAAGDVEIEEEEEEEEVDVPAEDGPVPACAGEVPVTAASS